MIREEQDRRAVLGPGPIDRFEDAPEVVVDPRHHPCVGGPELGPVLRGQAIQLVGLVDGGHVPGAPGRVVGDGRGLVGPVVEGEPRLLHLEWGVGKDQRHVQHPRLGHAVGQPRLGGAHDGLVEVERRRPQLGRAGPVVEGPAQPVPLGKRVRAVEERRRRGEAEHRRVLGRLAGGECVAPDAGMGHVVAGLLQGPQHARLPRLDEGVEGPVPGHVGVPAGQERHPALGAERVLAPCVGEPGARGGESVDERRLRPRVAEAAQRVGAQLVGDEHHQVRSRHRTIQSEPSGSGRGACAPRHRSVRREPDVSVGGVVRPTGSMLLGEAAMMSEWRRTSLPWSTPIGKHGSASIVWRFAVAGFTSLPLLWERTTR